PVARSPLPIYSALRTTAGSRRDARQAGRAPAAAATTARAITDAARIGTLAGERPKSRAPAARIASSADGTAIATPIAIIHTESRSTSRTISARVEPSDNRIPISLV